MGQGVNGAPADSAVKVGANRSILVTLGILAMTAGFALPAIMTGKLQLPDLGSPAETAAKSVPNYVAADKPGPSNSGMLLMRLVLGTVLVTGLSAGALWSAKRWLVGNTAAGKAGTQLRVLETLPLNYRCSVHLLQAGSLQVLAAVDSSGIKSLIALPEPFESTLRGVQVNESTHRDRADDIIVPMTRSIGR